MNLIIFQLEVVVFFFYVQQPLISNNLKGTSIDSYVNEMSKTQTSYNKPVLNNEATDEGK